MIDIDVVKDSVEPMLASTESVLTTIKSRGLCGDLLHDITRHNNIFPSLHNLLLGAIVSVYLIGDSFVGLESLQQTARDVVDMYSSRLKDMAASVRSIHPCILQATKTLSSARKGSTTTVEALRECCFLVPATCW